MDKKIFDRPINVDLERLRQYKGLPKTVLLIAAVVLGLSMIFSIFYQVQQDEEGVILRFGRFNRISKPGLNLRMPLIEEVFIVPVKRQLKAEFGFRTEQAAVRSRFSPLDYGEESQMLTGDLNVAVVEWIVQYRVSDPQKYLFKVRNVEETFRAMNEAMVREVVGDRTVTEVLTVGRTEVETTVQERLQELCNQYETGINVDQVVLQNVTPPDPVKPSWDEVNQAQQQKDRLVNEAQTEYNQVVPRATGEAQQTILQAEGYALERVNSAQGDATRFKDLYAAYRRAPQVTRQRMYLETMQKVLPQLGGKLFLDDKAKGVLPLLPLDQFKKAVSGQPRKQEPLP